MSLLDRCREKVHCRAADKTRHKGTGRLMVNFGWRTNLLNFALFDHHNAIGKRHRFHLIMGDVNTGYAKLTL
ncbi:Uncharacterised protein [Vibrio cholerae]|nr:Uncharacterised protein [Vibrio cholerae]